MKLKTPNFLVLSFISGMIPSLADAGPCYAKKLMEHAGKTMETEVEVPCPEPQVNALSVAPDAAVTPPVQTPVNKPGVIPPVPEDSQGQPGCISREDALRKGEDLAEAFPQFAVIARGSLGSKEIHDTKAPRHTVVTQANVAAFTSMLRDLGELESLPQNDSPEATPQTKKRRRILESVLKPVMDGKSTPMGQPLWTASHVEIMKDEKRGERRYGVMKEDKHWDNADMGSPENRRLRAGFRMKKGDLNGAKEDLDAAVKQGGGAPALAMRAGVNFKMGDMAAANEDANAALQIEPGNEAAAGIAQLTAGRGGSGASNTLGAAQNAFANQGGGGGGNPSAQGFSGPLANTTPGMPQSANLSRDAQAALRLRISRRRPTAPPRPGPQPQNAQAYNLRAMAYLGSKSYDAALRDAVAGLALAPNNPALLNTKARALLAKGDWKGALAAANQALELNPKDAFAFAQRAYALGKLGDRKGMLDNLKTAASLDSRFQSSLQSALQMPEDSDVMFLFPGENAAEGGPAGSGKGKRSPGIFLLAALVGGALIAFGLIRKVAPAGWTTQVRRIMGGNGAASPVGTSAGGRDDGAAPPDSGALLGGKFEIRGEIGSGGMGLVFEGLDRSLGRRVAIKKMRPEIRDDKRERDRFVVEAKTVASLKHENIVEIFSIIEEAGEVYLVFEFVEGKTLFEAVANGGPMPLAKAVGLLKGVADALDYAHGKSIVHRDLKPSNIMIDAEGKAKVMDFGVARIAKDALTRYSMTNTIMGTPPYMAPEQEQGVVCRESDTYSLAICLYEALTGRLPFTGTGSAMLMNKMNASYHPPTKLIPALPVGVDAVFARAFAPEPKNRFASARELVAALEASLPAVRAV